MICVHFTVGSARCLWSAFGRLLPFVKGIFGSISAGQDVPVRWSHPIQMAVQVECKQLVKSVQLPSYGRNYSKSYPSVCGWDLYSHRMRLKFVGTETVLSKNSAKSKLGSL